MLNILRMYENLEIEPHEAVEMAGMSRQAFHMNRKKYGIKTQMEIKRDRFVDALDSGLAHDIQIGKVKMKDISKDFGMNPTTLKKHLVEYGADVNDKIYKIKEFGRHKIIDVDSKKVVFECETHGVQTLDMENYYLGENCPTCSAAFRKNTPLNFDINGGVYCYIMFIKEKNITRMNFTTNEVQYRLRGEIDVKHSNKLQKRDFYLELLSDEIKEMEKYRIESMGRSLHYKDLPDNIMSRIEGKITNL